ncbi:MAG: hypothetical protein IJT32_00610 [Lachnospiraceae bacterium]|nr:hypothetical protein [Lachnospiraceae bacterium]
MIFQEFDKNNRETIKNLRERDKEAQSSSSVWHAQYTVDEERTRANVHERGQEQKKEDSVFPEKKERGKEGDKESRMQEVFHTENAFARLSLGLNEKGESSFVVARKTRADEKSTERSERELDEQRSYNWHVVGGDDKANLNKPAESAFGFYQTDKGKIAPHTRAHRILSRSQEFANLTGNMMTEEFVPPGTSKAGDTKELTARQLTLEHQLAIALERGKKKNEAKKDKEIIPKAWQKEEIKGKPKKNKDETAPRPGNRKNPYEEEDDWNGFPADEENHSGGSSGGWFGGSSGGSSGGWFGGSSGGSSGGWFGGSSGRRSGGSSGGYSRFIGRGAVAAAKTGGALWVGRKGPAGMPDASAGKPKKPHKLRPIRGRKKRIKRAQAPGMNLSGGIAGLRTGSRDSLKWLAFFAIPMVLNKEEEEKKKPKGKKKTKK